MAAGPSPGFAAPFQVVRDWPTPLCAPTCSCCLACWGCGCIPLYQIIIGAAPFKVLGSAVPSDSAIAMLIALVLWFGTIHAVGHTAGIVLLVGWIILSVELKNHLLIDESDIVTMIKAFLCPPCHVGQIKEAVDMYGAQSVVAQQPPVMGVPLVPTAHQQAFMYQPARDGEAPQMHHMYEP